jgi:hypothetical protein
MKIVVKDNDIIAVHLDSQEVSLDDYPGATEIRTLRNDIDIYNRVVTDEGLPTEHEDLVFKTLAELNLQAADEKIVRIIDGGKISQATVDELNGATTIAALRTVVSKILLGD